MKFIDFFSGIGGFHSGLEKAGMKCIGWCEFDKFAQASYRAIYDTDNLWFGDDVTKVKGKDLPKADLWTFGFPCQDISIAGNQKGIKKGTRSGLFYEIMRLLDECKENKPEWLMCENVKNLLSIDGGGGFLNVIGEMAERGYSIEWGMYNSKNYGVPQNRERVYIVGYYGNKCTRSLLPIKRESSGDTSRNTTITGNNFIDLSKQKVKITNNSRCLIARYTSGITNQAAVNSGVISVRDILTPDRERKRQNGRRLKENGEAAFTLTSQDRHGVLINKEVESGCKEISIRKLTPKECWRLQGFSDAQYEKAAAVNSNSQLYKQAGNAVTVNVVEEIGRHIMGVVNEETCKSE